MPELILYYPISTTFWNHQRLTLKPCSQFCKRRTVLGNQLNHCLSFKTKPQATSSSPMTTPQTSSTCWYVGIQSGGVWAWFVRQRRKMEVLLVDALIAAEQTHHCNSTFCLISEQRWHRLQEPWPENDETLQPQSLIDCLQRGR